MGLDMFLFGKKNQPNYNRPRAEEDGFEVATVIKELELAYWRKHPNLHGYIVQTFAGGVDKCQDIPLTVEDLKKILNAIKEEDLPYTEGFFFGSSDGTEKEGDIAIFESAINWLEKQDTENSGETRSVFYVASW
jgi:hypothetical protein